MEQSRTEKNRTEQNRTEQNRTEQNRKRAVQSKAEQSGDHVRVRVRSSCEDLGSRTDWSMADQTEQNRLTLEQNSENSVWPGCHTLHYRECMLG